MWRRLLWAHAPGLGAEGRTAPPRILGTGGNLSPLLARPGGIGESGEVLDEAEIRRFLREEYPRLVSAVALVVGDLATAEDAVQEAVVRAWERSERGEAIESLDRWIATVALNLSRSRLRHLRVERLARPRLARTEIQQPVSDEDLDVRRALAGLPRRQREVAVLHYLLDLGTRDVAAVMGTSEGTVKSQLSKARANLFAALGLQTAAEAGRADA
jgi:RNA polymerase sigma-70 factor, ECF subfamily